LALSDPALLHACPDEAKAAKKEEDTSDAEPEDDQGTPECGAAFVAVVVVAA